MKYFKKVTRQNQKNYFLYRSNNIFKQVYNTLVESVQNELY